MPMDRLLFAAAVFFIAKGCQKQKQKKDGTDSNVFFFILADDGGVERARVRRECDSARCAVDDDEKEKRNIKPELQITDEPKHPKKRNPPRGGKKSKNSSLFGNQGRLIKQQ